MRNKEFNQTMKMIKHLSPMIIDDRHFSNWVKNNEEPFLEIKGRQKNGRKSFWGKDYDLPDFPFVNKLSEAGNEFFDLLLDGFEFWIKKQPLVVDEKSPELSDDELRYIISWMASELEEGPFEYQILECRLVGESLVFSVNHGTFLQSQIFWHEFGTGLMLGPADYSENIIGYCLEKASFRIGHEVLKKFKAKKITSRKNVPCKKCRDEYSMREKLISGYYKSADDCEEMMVRMMSLENSLEDQKGHISDKEYSEKEKEISKLSKSIQNQQEKTENEISKFKSLQVPDIFKLRNFYRCNVCNETYCEEHGMGGKKICMNCYPKMLDKIQKERWPEQYEKYHI